MINMIDLQLFSDDEEDDQSFFEIAIHKGFDNDDDDDDEIELRISFSSSFVTPSVLWSGGERGRDVIVVDSPFSGDFSSSSFFSCSSGASPEPDDGKTTTFRGRRSNAVVVSSGTFLDSDGDITPPPSCTREPSENVTSPPTTSNGSGILNFLIKFPAAIKLQKLLSSFAKATANNNKEPKVHISSKTTSSQFRRRLHKFLTKWRNELGLRNMKSYCSFDDDQYKMDRTIIITSTEKKVKNTKRRRGFISNPNSIKSSPVHRAPIMVNDHDHDHYQSSIQAAIAHCRGSSTPDFCFSTPHHHRPF